MIEAYKFIQKSKLSKLDQVYRIFINTHNIMYNVDSIPPPERACELST
jgi:hypothetical protein